MDINSVAYEFLPLIPIAVIIILAIFIIAICVLYSTIRLKLKEKVIDNAYRGHRCFLEQLLTKKYISDDLKLDIRINLDLTKKGYSDTAEAEYYLVSWIIPLCNKLRSKYPLTEDDYIYWTNPDLWDNQ